MKIKLFLIPILALLLSSCNPGGIPNAVNVAQEAMDEAAKEKPIKESPLGSIPSLNQQRAVAMGYVRSFYQNVSREILEKYESKGELSEDDHQKLTEINKKLLASQKEAESNVFSEFGNRRAQAATNLIGVELPISLITSSEGPEYEVKSVEIDPTGDYLMMKLSFPENLNGCLKVYVVNNNPDAGILGERELIYTNSNVNIPANKSFDVKIDIYNIPSQWMIGQENLCILVLNRC